MRASRLLLLACLALPGCGGAQPNPQTAELAVDAFCAQAQAASPDLLAALPKDVALVIRSTKDACAERQSLLAVVHDAGADHK